MQPLRPYVPIALLLLPALAAPPHAFELPLDPALAHTPLAAFTCLEPPAGQEPGRSAWWLLDADALRGRVPLVANDGAQRRFREAAPLFSGFPRFHTLFLPYLADLYPQARPTADPGDDLRSISPGRVHLECERSIRARMGSRLPILGLFLLEDGRTRARFLGFPAVLPSRPESRRLLLAQVRRRVLDFLTEGRVEGAPWPLRDPAYVPPPGAGLPPGPLLLLPLSGHEARVPGDWSPDRLVEELVTDERGYTTRSFSLADAPPGAYGRYLLERLTPELKKRGIAAVGLVEEAGRIPELGRAFPGWTFLPRYPTEDPLRYYELSGYAWLTNGRGRSRTLALLPLPLGQASRPIAEFLDWAAR